MKKKLAKFLCWLLFKIDRHRLIQNQYIGKGSFSLNWEKYVPHDGMWHQINLNFSCWMLAGEPEVQKKDEAIEVYVDGAVIADYIPEGNCEPLNNDGMEPWSSGAVKEKLFPSCGAWGSQNPYDLMDNLPSKE